MQDAITPEQIDDLLPQTQCGLCGYGGCMPYAEAIVFEQAAINLCPPGGVKTLCKLAKLLNQDPTPYVAEMEKKAKPKMLASIREAECIGCTKCIQACPVDAILGSAKQMHTVLVDLCTGCELCVPPCPVDCIDISTLTQPDEGMEQQKAQIARKQFAARNKRLLIEKQEKLLKPSGTSLTKRKNYLEKALERAKKKKVIYALTP